VKDKNITQKLLLPLKDLVFADQGTQGALVLVLYFENKITHEE